MCYIQAVVAFYSIEMAILRFFGSEFLQKTKEPCPELGMALLGQNWA